MANDELDPRIEPALSTLSSSYQEVIRLRYFQGLSPKVAAESIGTSEQVFAVTLSRGLKALKLAMDRSS